MLARCEPVLASSSFILTLVDRMCRYLTAMKGEAASRYLWPEAWLLREFGPLPQGAFNPDAATPPSILPHTMIVLKLPVCWQVGK